MAKKTDRASRQPRETREVSRVGVSVRLKALMYRPATPSQRVLAGAWDRTVCGFVVGPAGTGKTAGVFGESLMDVIHRGRGARTIYLTRPTVQAEDTDDMGFLPGTLQAKFGAWLPAFGDILGCVSDVTMTALDPLLDMMPLGYARGRTVRLGTLIVDEAQNLTRSQLTLLLSRVGHGGRVMFCGDPDQCDLPRDKWWGGELPLLKAIRRLEREPDVRVIRTTPADQMRSGFVTRVLDRMTD